MRRLLRFPVRSAKAGLALLLVLGAAFLLLTRTEVGRDRLRVETERAFSSALQGELRIGHLSGNLVGTVYARGVEIYDPAGRLVLAADSVVVRPTWRALLMRRVVVGRATLVRPRVALVYEDGRWNLADAFRSRGPANPDADPLGLRLADVTLVDGSVTTRRIGEAPGAVADGAVFDYTDARLTGLYAQVSLNLAGDRRRLKLSSLRATLPDLGIGVRHLDAKVDFADGLRIAGLDLQTETTRLSGSFSLGDAPETAGRPLALDLDAPRLDLDEWARLLPALPVRDVLALQVEADGRIGNLDVRRLGVARGQSRVSLSGTVTGLPERAEAALTLAPSHADPLDLAAVWPEMPLPAGTRTLGRVDLSGEVTSLVPIQTREPFRLDARYRLSAQAARADGTLALRKQPGGRLGFRLDADAARLDPGALLALDALRGSVAGRVQVATPAAPGARDSLRVQTPADGLALRLDLTGVQLPGRSADALAADVVFADGGVQGTATVRQGQSVLSTAGRFGFRGGWSADLTARLDAFDLETLLPGGPRTRLTGRLALDAAGPTFRAWTGSAALSLDDGAVAFGTGEALRTVPLERLRIAVAPLGGSPRLRVESDVADLAVESPLALDALVPTLARWSTDLARAAGHVWSHPDSVRTRRELRPLARRRSSRPSLSRFRSSSTSPARSPLFCPASPTSAAPHSASTASWGRIGSRSADRLRRPADSSARSAPTCSSSVLRSPPAARATCSKRRASTSTSARARPGSGPAAPTRRAWSGPPSASATPTATPTST